MRSTVTEIDIAALRNNVSVIRSQIGNAGIMAMVKANAYGHGMIECAKALQDSVEMFGVAVMYEGVTLRLSRIEKPIVVMMPPDVYDAEKFCECDLQMVACSFDIMKLFNDEARKQNTYLKAHLYVDTGMRRDGVEPHEVVPFLEQCKEFERIEIIGICTHFATSDDTDYSFTFQQLEKFNQAITSATSAGYSFQYIHSANSGAVFSHPSSHFNLVRTGLALFGIEPSNATSTGLKPVLSLKTRINAIRRISAGESVSYGRRFIAPQETTIVTIPIGYGDGYSRLNSSRAECLIHGKRYPIVGTICMDECMIDVGDDEVKLGDDVVLIGSQSGDLGSDTISAVEIAQKLGTIPYEVTTMITSRVPRVLVGE